MRGTTLAQMIYKFRLEVGQSVQPGQGMQNRDHIAQGLRRVQETLYTDFDWPIFRIYREEALQPGEYLYSWPDDLNVEEVRQLYDDNNGQWVPVDYGISFAMRNAYGSTARNDPVIAWQIVDERQYEVWPTPAIARNLAIYGYKQLPKLEADTDTCALDDNMIILFYAAEWLARNKMADAPAKLSAANRLKMKLQGRLVNDKHRNVIPLVGGVSPNAGVIDVPRRVYGLPPPIPRS